MKIGYMVGSLSEQSLNRGLSKVLVEEAPEGVELVCPRCGAREDQMEVIDERHRNRYAGTETERNLEAAFAGESQARNKYTYFSAAARREARPSACCRVILVIGETPPNSS